MIENKTSIPKSIETALKWASRASVIVSICVLSLKTYAYFQTNSQAVLSDALESIVNVIASVVALWLIHISAEPADDEHPYGHGKMEYFSAAFEGGLVCFAGVMIIAEAVHALIIGQAIANFEVGFFYSILASLLNLGLGLYLKNIGDKHHSAALTSSGTHVLSDLWTTGGSLLGLGLVWLTGLLWIDAGVALLMAIYLLVSGYKVVRIAIGGLLDEHDAASLQHLASILEKNRFPGIIDIHQTRMIRAGRFHHIDAHVVVPEFWDVSEAHHQTTLFEHKVVMGYHLEGEIAFHVDPCLKSYCDQCDLESCPIRSNSFEKRSVITANSLTKKPLVEDEGL
jgi:cation diffusion facilitator family transporter